MRAHPHHVLVPVLASLGLVSAPALADRGDAPAGHVGRMFVAGDLSSSSRAGVETLAGTLQTGLLGNRELTVVTLDLVGDIEVGPSLKVHGRLPVVHYSDDRDDSGAGIGNLTGGARFVASGDDGSTRLGVGGSVSLPTASDEGESGAAAFYGGVFRNLHDPGRYLPNTTTVRAEADLALIADRLFVQGQLGVHLLFFEENSPWLFGGDDQQNLLRVGVGGGAWLGPSIAVIAEVTSFSNVLENEDDDDFVHTLDAGLQYEGGGLTATVRAYVPFDEGERTDDAVGLGLDLLSRF